MLGMKVRNYVIDRLLVEEKLAIKAEYFAGLVMDDARKCPVLVFSAVGGTGVEEIARLHPEKIVTNADRCRRPACAEFEARNLVRKAGLSGPRHDPGRRHPGQALSRSPGPTTPARPRSIRLS